MLTSPIVSNGSEDDRVPGAEDVGVDADPEQRLAMVLLPEPTALVTHRLEQQ